MKNCIFKKFWDVCKGKISVILIISLILSGLTPALNVSAKNINYQYANELEIDDTLVDDGMFYIPHDSIEVTENDSDEKYVFKIKRKGEAKTIEKVKLTMLDTTAKYDRDYSIKVVDKSFFSENIENKNVAKSVNEYIDGVDYEEYNYSDAIIDGSIDIEDIMTEDEMDNYEITDEDKKKMTENLDAISDSLGINIETDANGKNETNENEADSNEESTAKIESELESKNETISAFTNTENETSASSDESQNNMTNESIDSEEETTTKNNSMTEGETFAEEESSAEEKPSAEEESFVEEKSETEEEPTTEEESTTEVESMTEEKSTTEAESASEAEPTSEEQSTTENESVIEESTVVTDDVISETESDNKTENTTEESSASEDKNEKNNKKEVSTSSEVNNDFELVYSEDAIAFENVNKATMSISEGFEMATGLTDDRKVVLPDRSTGIGLANKNSLSDMAYMSDSIKIVEEELKSAYVILNFKVGQVEKLIEISIKNDKKYSGDRQVGFNLSEVDGSIVAGMYSSFTLIIHDDEEEVPEYINFSKKEYSPKDGYITVEIERSGHLGNISTCMLDTEDITAISGRDYSKVHAKVVFAMGINKRTVKIPISSKSIKNSATFKLKLQESAGALLGDVDTAICTIKKTDVSFNPPKKSAKKITESDNNSFGASSSNEKAINNNNPAGKGYLGSSDYNMNSIILTTPINLQNSVYSFTNKNGNENSYFSYINSGNGLKAYIENHDIAGETASFTWGVKCGRRRDISGYQINWAMSGTNNKINMKEYITASDSWNELGSWTSQEWEETTNDYFITNPTSDYLWFNMYRYDGWWRTSPTLTINSISPILRMYHIINVAPEVPQLIDGNGNLTSNHKYAKYAVTSIEGAQSDHTAVGWSGKKITVKFDQSIDNPFYIKRLLLVNDDGDTREITRNDDTEATTITFEVNNDFVTQYDSFIKSISRSGGGKNGEFKIKAELDTKKSIINIAKNKRVDVNIWHKSPTKSTEKIDTYEYNVGDILHFFANVKAGYADSYDCHGLNVYYIKPYSPDNITIRRPIDGSDYFPLDSVYSEIKVVPALTEKNTGLKVRINKSEYDSFDKNYGIFKNIVPSDKGLYYEYTIEKDSAKIAGKYFELKAKCIDDSKTPIWYENSNPNVKYTQNTYYFLGTESQNDNIIYLTNGRADNIEYSITGKAYYEEVPIGGKTVDKKWQAASAVGIIVDDTHYGYSGSDGSFETVPGKGINGFYKKVKIVSNGVNKYMSVKLSNQKTATKEYKITYDSGEKAITKTVYVVALEEVLISNIDKEHPHVTGVKVLNQIGSSFSAVYINDNITRLKAFTVPKKSDGTNYTYTYIDENGIEKTENESIKRVEFIAVDMSSHTIKKVIEATRSNADKTEWEAYYVFKKGYYQEYQSGDKLYVRIVTDKKVGDGKGDDIDGSKDRRSIPIFNETTYQALPTAIPFIEQADMQPDPVDITFINNGTNAASAGLFTTDQQEPANRVALPILGGLSTMINALGISFSIQTEGDRIRIYFGKKFKGKGNRYDGNGKAVSDTGYAITLDNFDEGIADMKDAIKTFGTKRLKTMTLGLPVWQINPVAGIYYEFIIYQDPASKASNGLSFEYTGGGGYVGAVLNLRYTFYFLIYGVPCFVGGEFDISLIGEFGMAVDEGTHITYEEPSQDFFDKLMNKTHFEFVFKAKIDASAYAGVGICGVVGFRGGFTISLTFLYNPFVKKKFANVRPVGFSVTGAIKIWADAIVLSIPIPIYKWPYPYNLGYFEDIEKVKTGSTNNKSNYGESNTSNELKPRPRSAVDSTFVANIESHINNTFGATYEIDDVKTIIDGVYDASEPSIMKYNDNKALLVYLDDDHSRGTLDRTVLRYTIYNSLTNTWSNPVNIWEGNDTADFSPNLCDAGDKILLSWSSRPTAVADDVPKEELIKNMEIYTTFFDKTDESFGEVERMTEDNDYDYYPKAVYDNDTGIITLYYLKKGNIDSFDTADELLNNIQPEINGAQMMYLVYDNPDGAGSRWLRDYYYPYEFPTSLSEEDKIQYINTWKGQRFANLSIDIGGETVSINNPAISDYDIGTAKIFDSSELQTEIDIIKTAIETSGEAAAIESDNTIRDQVNDFIATNQDNKKLYKVFCYVIEPDGNLETNNDTEIFIKIRSATDSEIKTIRITHNDESELMPKIISNGDNTYLFWIQNENTIKTIDLNDLIHKSIIEDHANKELNGGEVHIKTIDNEIIGDKITNFYPFVDDDNNIYVVWQQDSAGLDSLTDDFEIEFKQDLYAAGFIKTTHPSGGAEYSWSNPVRLTNNGKVNNLPTSTYINNKLLMVNNEYNLISKDDEYDITNSTLNALTFAPKSSLYVSGIHNNLIKVLSDGSATYESYVSLHNSGLSAAKGFDYTGTVTYDGQAICTVSGGSSDYVLPGNGIAIGNYSSATGGVSLPPIQFDLSNEQRKHLDKLKLTLNVVERNVGDEGKTSTIDVFDVKEEFTFMTYNENEDDVTSKHLRVIQDGESFVVTGVLKNSGNTDTLGNEKIYIIDQDNWDKPIATSEYLNLKMNKQYEFSIPIDNSILKNMPYGIKDLIVYVKNDEGVILSEHEIATVNAKTPFNFTVNGSTDTIKLKVGEIVKLNTTYEPNKKYRNATILYATDDQNIAYSIDNELIGITKGETTLKLTTKEFGGTSEIKVIVSPADSKRKDSTRGGSGGGGGGGTVTSGMPALSYVSTTLTGNNIYNTPPSGEWNLNTNNNSYRYALTNVDVTQLLNGSCNTINIDGINYLSNGLYKLGANGNYYMFDNTGTMLTGLQNFNGSIYYFEETGSNMGAMATGERTINGLLYYFNELGIYLLPSDGVVKVANGEWIYYPLINKWSFIAYTDKSTPNVPLTNGFYSIKDHNNSYVNYYFDASGFWVG